MSNLTLSILTLVLTAAVVEAGAREGCPTQTIQLAIATEVRNSCVKPEPNLIMKDFRTIESIPFYKTGTQVSPAHQYDDFKFKIFAPLAFHKFRRLFGVREDEYLASVGDVRKPLHDMSNPGASGMTFFLSHDDRYLMKTVEDREADFLMRLLPQYYINLSQNSLSLLTKFFGLYSHTCGGEKTRLVVMNNLFPPHYHIHEKYDLKGSTYKRFASEHERAKSSPTFKDLDFIEHHKLGFTLEPDVYEILMKTIAADLRILESYKIMDFSLLIGVHNLDLNRDPNVPLGLSQLNEPEWETTSLGQIRAINENGERVLLFLGIIDILQAFKLKKTIESKLRGVVHEDTSVKEPSFYCRRFLEFIANRVFRTSYMAGSAPLADQYATASFGEISGLGPIVVPKELMDADTDSGVEGDDSEEAF